MSIEDLTQDQKLELFELATHFQISDSIYIAKRTSIQNKDRWAIINDQTTCYCKSDDKWEYEPLPSSRDDKFIARTRYTLHEAVAIVMSEDFISKYIQK